MGDKEKLTVYVDAAVVRALRLASADTGRSQSDLAAAALRDAFMRKDAPSDLARLALASGPTAAVDRAASLRTRGATLAEIAADLNGTGTRTARGARYSQTSVCRLLQRRARAS